MHSEMPTWTELRSRLESNGLVVAIGTWIEYHGKAADPRPERQGRGITVACCTCPLDLADALAGLVCGHLAQAMATPLTLHEFSFHCPGWQPPQVLVAA